MDSEIGGLLKKKFTTMMRDKIQSENVLTGNNSSENYETYQDYLEAITVSINLENDLRLYRYHTSFSNQHLSLVGLNILNPDLIKLYGNNTYLIRCYHNMEKIFECAIRKFMCLTTHR